MKIKLIVRRSLFSMLLSVSTVPKLSTICGACNKRLLKPTNMQSTKPDEQGIALIWLDIVETRAAWQSESYLGDHLQPAVNYTRTCLGRAWNYWQRGTAFVAVSNKLVVATPDSLQCRCNGKSFSVMVYTTLYMIYLLNINAGLHYRARSGSLEIRVL